LLFEVWGHEARHELCCNELTDDLRLGVNDATSSWLPTCFAVGKYSEVANSYTCCGLGGCVCRALQHYTVSQKRFHL